MSFEKAKADLEEKGLGDHVIVLNESSATVAEAAHALGVEPASIAKTLSVLQGEKPVLIVTEGTAKLDNHKYKSLFHIKAKMIPYDEVEAYVGHAPGGVCPFGVNEGVAVYLDETQRLRARLEALGGMDVWETQTHFMLVCLRFGKASALKEYLAEKHGILIRDASNFEGLDERFFRIATQTPEENDRLVDAIAEWF